MQIIIKNNGSKKFIDIAGRIISRNNKLKLVFKNTDNNYVR